MGLMKIKTTTGKIVKFDPDEIISLTMDNFSGLTKIKLPDDMAISGTISYTVDETNDELLERIERA